MNRLIAVCMAALASGPALAATYKWVDEHGVTTYGEKPPAGRPAKVVETQPGGTLESGNLQQQKNALESQQKAQAPAAQPAAPASARGMDFDTYIRLQVGMSEGEVMLRAGKPDHQSVENFHNDIVKTLYYYPTAANPYITTVTLSGGTVTKLDRTKKTF